MASVTNGPPDTNARKADYRSNGTGASQKQVVWRLLFHQLAHGLSGSARIRSAAESAVSQPRGLYRVRLFELRGATALVCTEQERQRATKKIESLIVSGGPCLTCEKATLGTKRLGEASPYEFWKLGGGGGGMLLPSNPFTTKAAKGLLRRKRQIPGPT